MPFFVAYLFILLTTAGAVSYKLSSITDELEAQCPNGVISCLTVQPLEKNSPAR